MSSVALKSIINRFGAFMAVHQTNLEILLGAFLILQGLRDAEKPPISG